MGAEAGGGQLGTEESGISRAWLSRSCLILSALPSGQLWGRPLTAPKAPLVSVAQSPPQEIFSAALCAVLSSHPRPGCLSSSHQSPQGSAGSAHLSLCLALVKLNDRDKWAEDPKGPSWGLPGRGAISVHQGCRLLSTHSTHLHQLPGKHLSHRLGLGLGVGGSIRQGWLGLGYLRGLGRGSTLFLMAPELKSPKVRSEQRGFGEGLVPDSGSPGIPQGRLRRVWP